MKKLICSDSAEADYYLENGGDIQIIIKAECDHHPHSLENPDPIVDYIIKNFSSIKKEKRR